LAWLKNKSVLAGLAIVIAIFAAYSNSFKTPFVFDDAGDIEDNQSLPQGGRLSA
jgi:hypothetical protein